MSCLLSFLMHLSYRDRQMGESSFLSKKNLISKTKKSETNEKKVNNIPIFTSLKNDFF